MEKKEKIKKKVKVQRRWFLKNFLKIFFVMWAIFKAFIDRVEREVGGGIGMGNTCKSMADLCWCVTRATAILWSNWPPIDENK